MSDSLWPHGLQHAKFPCPSISPQICWNSCSLSQWCYLTFSSCHPLSFCLQSFPASGSFPVNWHFASGGQSIGVSASASVLPMSIQGWFPFGLTGLISLLSKGLSSPAPQFENIYSLVLSLHYGPTLTPVHWKNHSSDYMDLCQQSDVSVFLFFGFPQWFRQ